MAKHNENPQDPSTIADKNLCYSSHYATVEEAGRAPVNSQQFRGAFLGLAWDPHHERIMPTLSRPNEPPLVLGAPSRWLDANQWRATNGPR